MNRLLIWGTGNLAKSFISNQYNGEIVGFIETKKEKSVFMDKPVYGSEEIPEEYDYIIVANSYVSEIYDLCLQLNIDMEKVIFLYAVKCRVGCADLSVIKEILSEKSYINYCMQFGLLNDTFVYKDALQYQKLNKRTSFDIHDQYMWPVITDKYVQAGTIQNYFWQDLWTAKLIIKSGVKEHFDIGSRLDGFIAHLLVANILMLL